YLQFVTWQREALAARGDELRRAWLDELAGAPLLLDLPVDRARPSAQTTRGTTRRSALAPGLIDRPRALPRGQQPALSTILFPAFQVLLPRYTGQDDLCIGFGIARRDREALADTFGYMVNRLVLRSQIDAEHAPAFATMLQHTRERLLRAMG